MSVCSGGSINSIIIAARRSIPTIELIATICFLPIGWVNPFPFGRLRTIKDRYLFPLLGLRCIWLRFHDS